MKRGAKLADSLRTIARTALEARLLPEGGAIDYGKDRVTGSAEKGQAPPAAGELMREWEEFLARITLAFVRDVEHARRGSRTTGARIDRARDARITGERLYLGRPASWVAFVEGCSPQHVQRKRKAAGLDPVTGEKPKESGPLTSRELPEEE